VLSVRKGLPVVVVVIFLERFGAEEAGWAASQRKMVTQPTAKSKAATQIRERMREEADEREHEDEDEDEREEEEGRMRFCIG
jgi:ribosomal protein L12E/L44/L45/RPP1/RPP2